MTRSLKQCGAVLLHLAALMMIMALPVQAGEILVPGMSGSAFSVRVASMKESRFRTTLRQQHDFSCGSAALATLLTYHYDDAVSEEDIFRVMFAAGDQDRIRREGFSLLDMKKYLEGSGYRAAGYKVTLDKVAEIGVPAIVLLNVKGYKHFVVVKGISPQQVLMGDPAAGTKTISRSEFEEMWNGLVFVILTRKNVANNHFNSDREWQTQVRAPLGLALRPSELASVTMMLPGVLR